MTRTIEWALAMMAGTLAEGMPEGRGPADEQVREAAQWFVDLCQAAGVPVMCTSEGVWDLQRLEDDEVLAFGQALARDFFDRRGLKIVWAGDETLGR